MPKTKRILVVANKSWEADPLVSVCLNPKMRPAALLDWTAGASGLFSSPGNGARPVGMQLAPRCVCNTDVARIEVWCIEDWMGTANHSSSKVKSEEVLPKILAADDPPDFVVAFGTAGFPDSTTANGCVVVGSSAFVFNPYRETMPGVTHDASSDWDDQQKVGQLLLSKDGARVVARLGANPDLRFPIDARLIPAPTNPAIPPVVLPAASYVALSEVNITNYDDYAWTDRLAFEICRKGNPAAPVGSVETTHGLIRVMCDAPFIFVSGITDRLGYFNQELGPRTVAQNFLAAHNAGVGVVWVLPLVLESF
jgi:hypothetical protein